MMSKMRERSSVRTYDDEGFVKRAACICVNDSESKVLLVTSRKDSRMWIVPGGGVEPDELPDDAAVREVREEAGVNGSLGRCLGVFENAERGHRTSVYVLVVTEELEEWEDSKNIGRKRKWFDIAEAVEQLKHKPVQSSYVSLLLPQTISEEKEEHAGGCGEGLYQLPSADSNNDDGHKELCDVSNSRNLIVCSSIDSDDVGRNTSCDLPKTGMSHENDDVENHSIDFQK